MWEEQGVNMTKILYECMKCSKYIVCMYEILKNNITLKARRQQSILELAGKTLPWQSKISFVSFEYL